MKKKDLTYLALAVIILLVGGYLAYTQLFKSKTSTASVGTSVEVVGEISSSIDSNVLLLLADPAKSVDYTPPVDLTGLNNVAPFGQ